MLCWVLTDLKESTPLELEIFKPCSPCFLQLICVQRQPEKVDANLCLCKKARYFGDSRKLCCNGDQLWNRLTHLRRSKLKSNLSESYWIAMNSWWWDFGQHLEGWFIGNPCWTVVISNILGSIIPYNHQPTGVLNTAQLYNNGDFPFRTFNYQRELH